jgi:hypothetical protein
MVEWESMSVDEYAALEQQLGAKLCEVNGVWWRRVRPFFYRPLYPLKPMDPKVIHPPAPSWFGGVQYQVRAGVPANSWLHYVVSEPASAYSMEGLGKKDARAIRAAQKKLTVRRIDLTGELVHQAHEAYLEFYQRTRYTYKAERQDPGKFADWAAIISKSPKLLVHGAFLEGRLRAVSISSRVDDTVLYATFFAANEVLKLGGADLMLHAVRQAAADAPGVRRVFGTMFKGGGGHDSFYLYRGFQLVSRPAILRVNPILLLALRLCAPGYIARLRGEIPATVHPDAVARVHPAAPTAAGVRTP